MLKYCWSWLIGGAVMLSATSLRAAPPPIEAYAALPAAVNPRLSPDGNALAMISPVNDQADLVVRRLDDSKPLLIATGESFPNWFAWKDSNRLMASLRFTSSNSRLGAIGETRLVFMDKDGGNPVAARLFKDLPGPDVRIFGNVGNRVPQFQDRVVSQLPDDPDHLLMAVTPESDFVHPDVVLVDVHSGTIRRIVTRNFSRMVDWMADQHGQVRAGWALARDGFAGSETLASSWVRPSPEGEWVKIHDGIVHQGTRFSPVGFAPGDDNHLYVMMDGEEGRLALHAYDIAAGVMGPALFGAAPCDALVEERDHLVVAVESPCEAGGPHYLDPGWQHDHDLVAKALKSRFVRIIDRTDDAKRVLLRAREAPNAPDDFWLLDRGSGRTELKILGSAYARIPTDQVSPIRQQVYQARDGLPIRALVTLPLDAPPGPLPFVVLPHGGPTAQDSIQFDWIAQFLASRGYGVLQPQFRGSTGQGAEFQRAGYQQWGRAMQDDVTDGTRWLIDQKLADPARICIVGASYGGYAALMGVIKEPTLYACAAAFAPVTDLDRLVTRYQFAAFRDVNLPTLKGEGQDLDPTSPVENADKIQVPVLLMHGRKDFTVPVEHSLSMERALKRAHKQVEVLYLDAADHYFASGKDRLAWLTALDRFLATTIAPATPPPSRP